MKNKRILLIISILLLVIGFAAVTTTLFINGSTTIETNKDDFDVFYSKAKVNGVEDNSVIANDKEIIFEKTFKSVGDKYQLEYYITNGSKNYDADVSINCSSSSEYLKVTNIWANNTIIPATNTLNGNMEIELIKSSIDNEYITNVKCTINAIAVEKNELGDSLIPSKPNNPITYDISGILKDSEENIVNTGSMVVFSSPSMTDLSENGNFSISKISPGIHHIYYIKDKSSQELKELSEEEINNISTSKGEFTTVNSNIILSGGYTISNYKIIESPTSFDLYEKIALSSQGQITNFNIPSSHNNTNGVFETNSTDSENTIYYFRGNVNNNNIMFANYCWKILRTTENGGIKLLYNGTSCSNTGDKTNVTKLNWNNLGDDVTYSGYMYGNVGATNKASAELNVFDSNVKKYLEEWYETNLLSYQSYIDDEVYCNDRSIDSSLFDNNIIKNSDTPGFGQNRTVYSGTLRVGQYSINAQPTLKCNNYSDRFTVSSTLGNGKLKYPIGLITIDELAYSGVRGLDQADAATSEATINMNVFTNNNTVYWTMSPGQKSTQNITVNIMLPYGNSGQYYVDSSQGVRPVITIKKGIKISIDTDGTEDNPYTIYK